MSLLKLPEIKADISALSGMDVPLEGLNRYTPIQAKDSDNSIGIYDEIGDSWYSEGVTAKRIAAALRSIGSQEVVVNINSPGGDYFEGVAIYNLLRNHSGKVTVNVLGMAASAASIIAMAGDEIFMGDGANIMIHNAMAIAYGNKHDMQPVIDLLTKLDQEMTAVYMARTGQSRETIEAMLNAETWIGAEEAIEKGFATDFMTPTEVVAPLAHAAQSVENTNYLRIVDNGLRREGKTRSQRREIMSKLFAGKPSAAGHYVKPGADNEVIAAMQSLLNSFKGN